MNKLELLKLYDMNLEELIDRAEKVTAENFTNEVEVCSIISARTGSCGENCKYCSQSIHNRADIICHPLLSVEEVKNSAKKARENGATRFCIVTSGRGENGQDFDKILEMIKAVREIEGIHCCASLGLLNKEQIKQIKEAGVERFNHNINTSETYHKEICTTHSFQDRINTVKMIQEAGIEACTGVILGMGETREDRIDMALSLADLNPKTVPINILNPIKGTPLEEFGNKITEEEVIRTICIFRIILPRTILRYAGGRNTRLSHKMQLLGFRAGINGMLAGNYLTTKGCEAPEDIQLVREADKVFSKR